MRKPHAAKQTDSAPDAGFTLIEMLVAMVILSLGLLAVASLLMTAITMNGMGRSTNQAISVAREKIEELKVLPAASAPRDPGGSLTSNVSGYHDSSGAFQRRWEITTGPANLRVYTIRVIPITQDNRRNKTVTMSTIF